MKVKEIMWLDESILEAEVRISDGNYELVCFSQPLRYKVNEVIEEPLYCLDVANIQRIAGEFKVVKLEGVFSYQIVAKLSDKKQGMFKLGGIYLEVDDGIIPKDIQENEFVVLNCSRIDIF